MKWMEFLKKSDTTREDWNSAIKSFIDEGKRLGVPLDIISLLKEAGAMTTSSSDAHAVINPTFGDDEDDEDE
ncbi:MAG: hypothetical protein CL605_02410 [Altibacter sp.]|uniref:hypothetical protein n=1 Tax=Altibacter sp. TaxID=2024823 RepID=UPI000C90F958|nr:hypothetical protein [Altibacter sp.]MAP53734.1 hypothetical protein [Altibacter sp.]|tara:strand:- start:2629 stop:2844 length:216 start_codon:yes stop_codon:yes gene_type:complete